MSHKRSFLYHSPGLDLDANPVIDNQGHRRSSAGATSAMSPWGDDNGNQIQRQMQAQRLRSIQASEQMLYDVYEHTMGMIEELEKHEHAKCGKSAPNSGLLKHIIPRDAMQHEFEVNVKIETELTCLQAQMKFAPSEAKEKAVHEMLQKTILWLAARQENGIPIGPVDYYARNVWQILNEEAITLPEKEKRPEIKLDEGSVNDLLHNYFRARNEGEKQDKAFHDDPNKKAGIRRMRQGTDEQLGKDRLMELDKDQMC